MTVLSESIKAEIKMTMGAVSPLSYDQTTGRFSLLYNTSNMQLTSGRLNTIQNIGAGASPEFAGLTLTGFSGVLKATAGVIAGGATKADIGLDNVENTAISTWAGSANVTTLGTISTGVWSGTSIAANKVVAAGSAGQVQFNNTGLGADSNLTWDNTNKALGVGISPTGRIHVGGKVVIGDDLYNDVSHPVTFKMLVLGNTSGNIFTYFGQGDSNNAGFGWVYNATPASAYAWLYTFGYSNDLYIDAKSVVAQLNNSTGKMGIGIAPAAKLDVKGITSDSSSIAFRVVDSSSVALFTVRCDGGFAFKGGTVGLAQTGYSVSNVSTDRAYDANSTTTDELADVLGTLIGDLITKGIISA
jgi:hypothetical protein